MTVIGVVRISLAIPAETLKEKRSVVKSTVERLRARFNASVAEVEDLDMPSRAVIVAVCVSNATQHAQSQIQHIADAVAGLRLDVEVLAIETEIIHL